MLIVLSPAKKLSFNLKKPLSPALSKQLSQPELLDHSKVLVRQLKTLSAIKLKSLMGISDKLAQLNFQRYQTWHSPFTIDNSQAAIHVFQGDVYAGLSAKSLNLEDLLFSNNHVRILSGLYGILKPLDLIQPYRLEMGTVLKNPRGKHLYAFWQQLITEQLNRQLKTLNETVLINLASDEYYKSIQPQNIQASIIKPVFKDKKNGQYKIISFYAKKARGMMTRFVINNKLKQAEDIKAFNTGGYQYNQTLSQSQEWIFTRETL